MTESAKVAVVVEDEPQIRRFVKLSLAEEGWQVHEAETLRRGLAETSARKPDLIVLDLGLPDGDGIDFISDIRSRSTVPIIVLSARTMETEKVRALDAGADDYLTKPFGVEELLARVRSMLRRQQYANQPSTLVSFGDVTIDTQTRLVKKAGQVVKLSPTEYRLLAALIANAGKVATTQHLLRAVWGPAQAENAHYLRIYMSHLRQKLEEDPTQSQYLLTETGVGYRLLLPG
ncbi:two-component system, OmpR family, KDP operon response regulator KdpE [Noviherbaspirillum humi]|uniref:Two-component system, OmpR family, KDP operon response regulator KdpE n=1 Tax=Noviherbaspirillum humi TaxID=1688639 RepID=A0A239DNU2_9BURK|nr:response regulator [Noviherbaspirillum humi]SNS34150.1 two-component system, OmpR family, KDP operon response regulator KdpE [Noviherbaspirillum humi]